MFPDELQVYSIWLLRIDLTSLLPAPNAYVPGKNARMTNKARGKIMADLIDLVILISV